MAELITVLPSKIFEVVERAGISTARQIITLSNWDIKKLTNMRNEDIMLMKNAVACYLSPKSITCDKLAQQESQFARVTTGCVAIDTLLRGGLRRGTLTEIYGESGSGKTQVALQAAAHNWIEGSVYICTEDLFPVKRFEQVKQSISNYNSDIDYGKNVFVEHITEANELLSCTRVRLPKLLDTHKLSLIIIDSVTAPFRSEYTNYVQRAEDLRELAMSLIHTAQHYNLAVLCINQVTANFSSDNVLPSLGLAWSNMVCTRLWLRKTPEAVTLRMNPPGSKEVVACERNTGQVRKLSVIFAPDLPNSKTYLTITPIGIQSLK